MNSPITQQFGLDQIPETFTGTISSVDVAGPGVWIGKIDISGDVPLPSSIDSSQQNYTF